MENNVPNNRTGLWSKESKSGNKFLSGNLKIEGKEYSIRIFKNERKEKSNQPDYTMFYDLKEKNQEAKSIENDNKEVQLTDEDFDKMLGTSNEVLDEQLELPFL